MTINVVVCDANSKFAGGLAQGCCNWYDTGKKIVMKGNFVHSKLTGSANTLINYTDTTFKYFYGHFANNLPDGNMIVYDFSGNGEPLDEIVGTITVQKKNCIYSAGNLVSTITTQDVQVNIEITYRTTNNTVFMTEFNVTEI